MPKLEQFGPEIWTAEGPVVSFLSFPYPTRMAVIRLSGGALLVWSPIPLDDALRAEVDGLGAVAHLVTPNLLHHFWLGDWKQAYPNARLYAAPGLIRRRRDLKFDRILGDRPEAAWAAAIDQAAIQGNVMMTEIVFLHRASRTAIFGDTLQNFRPDWFKGWRGTVARWDGLVNPDYGAPRELRVTFWSRKRARRSLERILDFAPERVLIAHGEIARENGTEFIRKGFRWLLG
jgi:Domain of unknown function (DUF4336)